MAELEPGVYERLITAGLDDQLPDVAANSDLVAAGELLGEIVARTGAPGPSAARIGRRCRCQRALCWSMVETSPGSARRCSASWHLFQWESQNGSHAGGGAGERYVHHRDRGSSVHLFFRETKEADGDLGAPPYVYAGPATYVSHTGDRPMRIIWKLDHELPADVFHSSRVATG